MPLSSILSQSEPAGGWARPGQILRHTCATLLLLAGEHPKVVSERLGHSSISITPDTYSHVLPTMQAGAAAKLADMLEAAPALGVQPAEQARVVPLRRQAEGPGR